MGQPHKAEPLSIRAKQKLMVPRRLWVHVLYPLWLRWYKWELRSARWQSGLYEVGQVVRWHGIRLVCCTHHFAGSYADHPWDPGHGWSAEKAAALWEPATALDRALLRVVGDPRRSREEG